MNKLLFRFGMLHPSSCLGLVLVHPTSTTAGVMEHFKDTIIGWKLDTIGHNPTAEQYLVFHKFGERVVAAKNKEEAMEEFRDKLHQEINPRYDFIFLEKINPLNETCLLNL